MNRARVRTAGVEGLDLNLLRVLDALLTEQSVSRAAVRLRRSQPAVSNALARLRKALGDPLFVRVPGGLAPTERALQISAPVRAALSTLASALRPAETFDPRTAQRTFSIAASDHAQLVVLPQLARFLAAWPKLRLRVVALPSEFPLRELERGELDLVLGIFDVALGDRSPTGLKRQRLVNEGLVVVGRKGHPGLRAPLVRAAQLPQLNISPRGGTFGRLERQSQIELERNIVLYIPHYLAAPWVLASSDLLAVLPERIAARFCETFPLDSVPLPTRAGRLPLHQLWHPRVHEEPAHRWLRGEVLAAACGEDRSRTALS